MHALIAIGGEIRSTSWLQSMLDEDAFDLVVAADAGSKHLLDQGVQIDLLVGDLDSIDDESMKRIEAMDVEVLRYSRYKDYSDTELAILEALDRGAVKISLYGSFGKSRPDHLFSNLLLLGRFIEQYPELELTLNNGESFVYALRGPIKKAFSLTYIKEPHVISLFSLSDQCTGVDYEGLVYPLEGATIHRGESLALSNVAIDLEKGFHLSLEKGTALLFLTTDE